MRGGRRWLPHSKELDADRGNLEVRLLRLALAMKDVERVLRVVLQAADVLGAELGEVESFRLFTVDAAEIDLVLGSGLGLGGRGRGGGWWLELGVRARASGQGWGLNRVLGPRFGVGIKG